MKKGKRLFPVWLAIIIDLCIIAAYVGGFYQAYYRTPRQLESVSAATTVAEASDLSDSSASDPEEGTVNRASSTEIVSSTGIKSNADTASSTEAANNTDTINGATSENNASAENDINSGGGTGTANSTASSSSTDAEAASDSTSVDLQEKYAEHFTDTIVSTDNSYSSKDISITVNQYSTGSGNDKVTYYIADIYLANITLLQSGFAQDTYGVGYTDTVLGMDEELDAILAINGDYYGNGEDGVVIRNGEVYRTSTNGCDVCVLYRDGTMKTYSAEEFDADHAISDGAWQAWSFGPELLNEEGNSMTQFTTDNHIRQMNPRSAIGYYEPGHYCLIVVDGRQSGYSKGMTLTELSSLFKELGCTAAYNLDGGKSSSMTFNDTEVNQACDGGREVSDCVIIKETD